MFLKFLQSCLLGLSLQATLTAADQPNIIFIITDDQGWGDLSCHGNPILKTPNLDRLHKEGVRFTDFQVAPTCAPTRSALLTGRHEFRNGVTHTISERERLNPESIAFPEMLASAGYANGIFGKWHLGDEEDHWPVHKGFEEVFTHGAGGIGQTYPGSCGDAPGNKYMDPWVLHNGKFEKTKGYCTDVFFQQALKWMEQKKGKQPFYCHIATNAPHAPLQVRPEDEARYAALAPNADVAKFWGMIANIDDNVGRLLDKLKEWDIDRNTLVVFMNDNGGTAGCEVFNGDMRGRKGTPWQGGIRAASFWRWPGTLTPGDRKQTCANIDFCPTMLELAGVKPMGKLAGQIDGRSLVPVLKDANAAWEDRLLVTHVGRWPVKANPDDYKYANCSVRRGKWCVVSIPEKPQQKGKQPKATTPNWMLFDLAADYSQKNDVAGANPEVVASLSQAYDEWWLKTRPLMVNENATLPEENPFHTLFKAQGKQP